MAKAQTPQQTSPETIVEPVEVSSGRQVTRFASSPSSFAFVFKLDTDELESAWQEASQRIESSLSFSEEFESEGEAAQWGQVEKWLLKGNQRQAKGLALQVARLEFMMKAMTQNLEAGLSQSFAAWSQHFDDSLGDVVSGSIAKQVESLVPNEVQRLQANLNQNIEAQISAKTAGLVAEITTAVLNQLQPQVGALVERQMLNVQNQVVAAVMKDVTQLIATTVSQSLAAHTLDIDMDAINRRINHNLQLIAKLESDLYVRINHGDTQLYNWIVKELLGLKGCMTDREVLVEQLAAFTSLLQVKLETAPCLTTNGFGQWEGMKAVPKQTGAGGAATATALVRETPGQADDKGDGTRAGGPDEGPEAVLAEIREFLKDHDGLHTAEEIAAETHQPEVQVQQALDQLEEAGEADEWNGAYGRPDAVSELKAIGDAALAFLKAQPGLQSAAEVAEGINQPGDRVQQALDQLEAQGDVLNEHGRYSTPEEVAVWNRLLEQILAHLKASGNMQTAGQVAEGIGEPQQQVQQALDELTSKKKVDEDNGRYGIAGQVQAARELAQRIRDQLDRTKALDTAAALATALGEPEPKVQTALDQLKARGEVDDWNGRYGTPAEVDALRRLGGAILDYLRAEKKLLTAAEIAEGVNQPEAEVQRALDQLEAQRQVAQANQRYGLPKAMAQLDELGNEILAHLKKTGLQSAAELARALGKRQDRVQSALDQLKTQNKVADWHGRYDLPDEVEALRALCGRILEQLPKTPALDTAGELAQALGMPEKAMQAGLDELVSQGAVKNWNGRYGLPNEVAQQIETAMLVPEVTTVAGNGKRGFGDGRGDTAKFYRPLGVAIDASGTVYVADSDNHRIRKISPDGVVTTLAGGKRGREDGRGGAARFRGPTDVAVDANGVVYVADFYNNRIRRISPDGTVTTLAEKEKFSKPEGVAVDASGMLYVTDTYHNRVVRISPAGDVATMAERLHHPRYIAVDASGFLYVSDGAVKILKIAPDGTVTTLAGKRSGYEDGQGEAAKFRGVRGVAVDATGLVYVADQDNNCIRTISPDGMVSTLAGSGRKGHADGPAKVASFNHPFGVVVSDSGVVYVGDNLNHSVRKLACLPGGPVASSGVAVTEKAKLKVAQPVRVQWRSRWYAAEVLQVLSNDQFRIHYTGWSSSWDETVPRSRIQLVS